MVLGVGPASRGWGRRRTLARLGRWAMGWGVSCLVSATAVPEEGLQRARHGDARNHPTDPLPWQRGRLWRGAPLAGEALAGGRALLPNLRTGVSI